MLVRHRERVLILYDRVSTASETMRSRLSTCSVVTSERILKVSERIPNVSDRVRIISVKVLKVSERIQNVSDI